MNALIILCSLMLALMSLQAAFTVMLYNQITRLLTMTGEYQAEEYRKAVAIQKAKKPSLPPVKEQTRGHNIAKSDDLVDIADLDWEEGYKAVEEVGNG